MQPEPADPAQCPFFCLAQTRLGPARQLVGPSWHGPEEQAVPRPYPKHVGRHSTTRSSTTGLLVAWPATSRPLPHTPARVYKWGASAEPLARSQP